MFKKLLLSLLTALVIFVSVAPNFLVTKAASPSPSPTSAPTEAWYNSSFPQWYDKVYGPNSPPSEIFGERYTAAQVQWVIYGLWSFLINNVTGPQNSQVIACIMGGGSDLASCIKSTTGVTGSVSPSTETASVPTQSLWKLVFATNRPLSGIAYVKGKIDNFSLVPVAHAAGPGFGFDALAPVQEMWTAVRNVSYGLFVIVAVVFAFMIMFRIKLSPQVVISVQSALPKLIISLVLVTFSYAIAGFLIDFMYIVIGLVSLMFAGFAGWVSLAPGNVFNLLTLGQPIGYNFSMGVFGLSAWYCWAFLFSFIALLFANIISIVSAGAAVPLVGGVMGGILSIIGIIFTIVVIIVSIWNLFKIILSLVKAFVNVLLLTIFAPLQLTLGNIVPSLDFGSWIKSYVSNLAVFVVTGVLFLFSFIFLAQGIIIGFKDLGVDTWASELAGLFVGKVPNLVAGNGPNAWPPLLGLGGNTWTGLLMLIVSFVIFTLIPKANEIIQGLLSGKPYAYGSAIGEAFGGIYEKSGVKDYAGAIQSIRQSRTWNDILNSRPGKQITRALVGGQVEEGKSNAQAVTEAMARNKRGH